MKPAKDEFESGKFYRRWIQRTYVFGYIVFPLLGLFDSLTLTNAIVHHSAFGIVMSLIGIAIVAQGVWRTPGQIRDVRRRWMEMDVLTRNSRALHSRIDVHLGRRS